MVIDCYWHFTTEPRAHHAFREARIVAFEHKRRVYPRLDAMLKARASWRVI